MPMDEEGEETFTVVIQVGLVSPRRVPQEVLNVTPSFQSTMGNNLLNGGQLSQGLGGRYHHQGPHPTGVAG